MLSAIRRKEEETMIITLKKDAPKAEVEKLIHTFENKGLSVTMIQGDN